MALINCPECNREISDKVKACPHCGYPLVENLEDNNTMGFTEHKSKKISPQKKKVIKLVSIIAASVIILAVAAVLTINAISQNSAYESALNLYDQGEYMEAKVAFEAMSHYKDSADKALECQDSLDQLYSTKFDGTAATIYINTLSVELRCYLISEEWDDAIDNGDDFNTAIQTLIQEWKDSGSITLLEESKDGIDTAMKELQEPIESYSEAYSLLVDMYGLYIQLYDQATSPSGSLMTYNSDINDLASEFEKVYNQITIIVPNVEDQVEEEKENFDLESLL